jgi:hypothetical protein
MEVLSIGSQFFSELIAINLLVFLYVVRFIWIREAPPLEEF